MTDDQPESPSAIPDDLPFEIRLSGEIDAACLDDLRRHSDCFDQSDRRNVVVDLSQVTFMDSTGLGLLTRLYRRCEDRGGRITVVGARRIVLRVLQVSGFDTLCDMRDEPGATSVADGV